ncbi:MAG: hypothetical protein EOO56_19925 [Hymenobacter sp.]|nr:MAG: hypothetical protein EOO56_19925 [Hymenobacter sp.]
MPWQRSPPQAGCRPARPGLPHAGQPRRFETTDEEPPLFGQWFLVVRSAGSIFCPSFCWCTGWRLGRAQFSGAVPGVGGQFFSHPGHGRHPAAPAATHFPASQYSAQRQLVVLPQVRQFPQQCQRRAHRPRRRSPELGENSATHQHLLFHLREADLHHRRVPGREQAAALVPGFFALHHALSQAFTLTFRAISTWPWVWAASRASRFPKNSNSPYVARSITEFWQRWRITLGRWMRDYLYIAFGTNRLQPSCLYLNLWTVFILSGFWHGATWNFLAWGAYHGFFLVLDRFMRAFGTTKTPCTGPSTPRPAKSTTCIE